ncbi:hypothetical protein [Jatrophihabitans sp.]|uniref:hypothetical protein n=1 Tax=Jatrophihabitans sp. TaxID=1932789 RepID=UPI0030C6FE51
MPIEPTVIVLPVAFPDELLVLLDEVEVAPVDAVLPPPDFELELHADSAMDIAATSITPAPILLRTRDCKVPPMVVS